MAFLEGPEPHDGRRRAHPYLGFLAELLRTECDDRARRRSERRIKAAQFPRDKSLRACNFDANPGIDPATIHTLATCEWVKNGQPPAWSAIPAPASPTCSSPPGPRPR
ncbi:ATP-binding protein [Spirillospora sp. CA-108201]